MTTQVDRINSETPSRIRELEYTITKSVLELDRIMTELSVRADKCLAESAREFLEQQPEKASAYTTARNMLLKHAIAASNISEAAEAAHNVRAKAYSLTSVHSHQLKSDMNLVCGKS